METGLYSCNAIVVFIDDPESLLGLNQTAIVRAYVCLVFLPCVYVYVYLNVLIGLTA